MKLINTENFQKLLKSALSDTSILKILSAYITDSAVDAYLDLFRKMSNITVVARASPSDFISGASTFSALSKLLDLGVHVRIHRSLHAKVYLLDSSQLFVGSANFTNNGLKLSGYGNLELMTEIKATSEDISLVDTIIQDSTILTHELLDKMKNAIADQKSCDEWWSEDIIKIDNSLWINDFPWLNPTEIDSSPNPESLVHDESIFPNTHRTHPEKLLNAKVFRWLGHSINNSDKQALFFGELTSMIHSEIKDNPAPYRSDVKQLTQNLLGYCQKYLTEYFIIDRPRHSQRVRLIK